MFFRTVDKSGQIFLPFCHNTRVWQTDGRTDRQTDRILITIPRLHYMQRGKNVSQQHHKKPQWTNLSYKSNVTFLLQFFLQVLHSTTYSHDNDTSCVNKSSPGTLQAYMETGSTTKQYLLSSLSTSPGKSAAPMGKANSCNILVRMSSLTAAATITHRYNWRRVFIFHCSSAYSSFCH